MGAAHRRREGEWLKGAAVDKGWRQADKRSEVSAFQSIHRAGPCAILWRLGACFASAAALLSADLRAAAALTQCSPELLTGCSDALAPTVIRVVREEEGTLDSTIAILPAVLVSC